MIFIANTLIYNKNKEQARVAVIVVPTLVFVTDALPIKCTLYYILYARTLLCALYLLIV